MNYTVRPIDTWPGGRVNEILSPEEFDGALLDAITSESGAMVWDRELKLRAHDLALRAQCEAERQARLDAERTLDETVTKLVRERTRATDAERERDELRAEVARHHDDFERWEQMAANGHARAGRAEAERDALAAAAGALLNHMGWSAADKGGYRTDKCGPFLSALAALLPSPASQEAVSE